MFTHNDRLVNIYLKSARPNLQEKFTVHTKIIRGTDKKYYKKLVRVIKYLRGGPETPLTLESNNTHVIKW